MRLIDADTLWKDITTHIDECADILEIIDRQPTVEPMRKKGKWIRKPSPDKYHCGYVICPYCKGEYVESDGDIFCPICGSYNG